MLISSWDDALESALGIGKDLLWARQSPLKPHVPVNVTGPTNPIL